MPLILKYNYDKDYDKKTSYFFFFLDTEIWDV